MFPQVLLAGQDGEWDVLARAQYNEAVTFLDPYLLSSQGDRVAMAHAVEERFPFLDVRVVEYSNSLPARLKMHGLSEKTLLRRAVADLVPRAALERPKRPFRAPIQAAFADTRRLTTPPSCSTPVSSRPAATCGRRPPRTSPGSWGGGRG